MKTAIVSALRRIDGMGNQCERGSYIQVAVRVPGPGDNTEKLEHYKISLGQADQLRAELAALGRDVPNPKD